MLYPGSGYPGLYGHLPIPPAIHPPPPPIGEIYEVEIPMLVVTWVVLPLVNGMGERAVIPAWVGRVIMVEH